MFETHALNHDLEEHKAPSMMSAEIILPLSANEVRLHLSVFLSLATLSFSHISFSTRYFSLSLSLYLFLYLFLSFCPSIIDHMVVTFRERKKKESKTDRDIVDKKRNAHDNPI